MKLNVYKVENNWRSMVHVDYDFWKLRKQK
jgi:hypothetical protein